MNLKSKIVAVCAVLCSVVGYAATRGDQNPAIFYGQVTCPSYDGGAGGSISIPNMSNANAIGLANEGSAKVYIGNDAGVSPTTGFPIAASSQLGIDIVQVTQGQNPGPFDGGVVPVGPQLWCTTASGSTTDLRFIRVK